MNSFEMTLWVKGVDWKTSLSKTLCN